MARIIRTERYKRGVFGWFFKIVFIAFNVFMALWFGVTIWLASQMGDTLMKPGPAAGFMLGSGVIVFIWALGSLILGMLTYFTRGKKVIIEEMYE